MRKKFDYFRADSDLAGGQKTPLFVDRKVEMITMFRKSSLGPRVGHLAYSLRGTCQLTCWFLGLSITDAEECQV